MAAIGVDLNGFAENIDISDISDIELNRVTDFNDTSDLMPNRCQYRKKPDQYIIAVQVNLDTEGFTYQKWGGAQRCQRGDWLVNNDDDLYTIDGDVFERTYRKVEEGRYVKTTPVWAEVAPNDGQVETKEGVTHYKEGDYLVSNNEDGTDAYAITAKKFEAMYELVD